MPRPTSLETSTRGARQPGSAAISALDLGLDVAVADHQVGQPQRQAVDQDGRPAAHRGRARRPDRAAPRRCASRRRAAARCGRDPRRHLGVEGLGGRDIDRLEAARPAPGARHRRLLPERAPPRTRVRRGRAVRTAAGRLELDPSGRPPVFVPKVGLRAATSAVGSRPIDLVAAPACAWLAAQPRAEEGASCFGESAGSCVRSAGAGLWSTRRAGRRRGASGGRGRRAGPPSLHARAADPPPGAGVLRKRGKPDVVPGLIQALQFVRDGADIDQTLAALTGEPAGKTWPEWASGSRPTPRSRRSRASMASRPT